MKSNKKTSYSIPIVGFGAMTPLGINAPMSVASIRAGITRFEEYPQMIDKSGELAVVSSASYISEKITIIERFLELGIPAAQESILYLGNCNVNQISIPIILGLPHPRPGLPENYDQIITNSFKEKLHKRKKFFIPSIKSISCGHSAGLMSIETACDEIKNSNTDLILAGGLDSYFQLETLEWLDERNQLHSETNKYGFIPGEAASFCLLASYDAVAKYNLNILGKIQNITTSNETNLIYTDTICLGEGLSTALWQVMNNLQEDLKIHQTICDLNGERYRVDEYGFTLVRSREYFENPSEMITPAEFCGDTGAASGPLFICIALIGNQKGYNKGANTLIHTSSESGERTVALISSP